MDENRSCFILGIIFIVGASVVCAIISVAFITKVGKIRQQMKPFAKTKIPHFKKIIPMARNAIVGVAVVIGILLVPLAIVMCAALFKHTCCLTCWSVFGFLVAIPWIAVGCVLIFAGDVVKDVDMVQQYKDYQWYIGAGMMAGYKVPNEDELAEYLSLIPNMKGTGSEGGDKNAFDQLKQFNINEDSFKVITHFVTSTLDSIQKDEKCCGFHGYKSWLLTFWFMRFGSKHSTIVPESCCKSKNCGQIDDSMVDFEDFVAMIPEMRAFDLDTDIIRRVVRKIDINDLKKKIAQVIKTCSQPTEDSLSEFKMQCAKKELKKQNIPTQLAMVVGKKIVNECETIPGAGLQSLDQICVKNIIDKKEIPPSISKFKKWSRIGIAASKNIHQSTEDPVELFKVIMNITAQLLPDHDVSKIHADGCEDKIIDWLLNHLRQQGTMLVILGGLNVFVSICCCFVARSAQTALDYKKVKQNVTRDLLRQQNGLNNGGQAQEDVVVD